MPGPYSSAGGKRELEQAAELGYWLAQSALKQGAGALLTATEELQG